MIAREIAIKMKSFAHYETVKLFRIVPKPFTVDTGELTPSMKIKRKVISQKYNDLIESMYT